MRAGFGLEALADASRLSGAESNKPCNSGSTIACYAQAELTTEHVLTARANRPLANTWMSRSTLAASLAEAARAMRVSARGQKASHRRRMELYRK